MPETGLQTEKTVSLTLEMEDNDRFNFTESRQQLMQSAPNLSVIGETAKRKNSKMEAKRTYSQKYSNFLRDCCSLSLRINKKQPLKLSKSQSLDQKLNSIKSPTLLQKNIEKVNKKIIVQKDIKFYEFFNLNDNLSDSLDNCSPSLHRGMNSKILSSSSNFVNKLNRSKLDRYDDEISGNLPLTGKQAAKLREKLGGNLKSKKTKTEAFQLTFGDFVYAIPKASKNLSPLVKRAKTAKYERSNTGSLSVSKQKKYERSNTANLSDTCKDHTLFKVFQTVCKIQLDQKVTLEENYTIEVILSLTCSEPRKGYILPKLYVRQDSSALDSYKLDESGRSLTLSNLTDPCLSLPKQHLDIKSLLNSLTLKDCHASVLLSCKIQNDKKPAIIGFEKPEYQGFLSQNFIDIKLKNEYGYKIRIASDTGRPDLVTTLPYLRWPIEHTTQTNLQKQIDTTLSITKVSCTDAYLFCNVKTCVTIYNDLIQSKILKISTSPRKIKQSDKKFKIIVSQVDPSGQPNSASQEVTSSSASVLDLSTKNEALILDPVAQSQSSSPQIKARKLHQKDVTWPCLILRDSQDEYELIQHPKKPILYHEVMIDQNPTDQEEKTLTYSYEFELLGMSHDELVIDEFVFDQPGSVYNFTAKVVCDKIYQMIKFDKHEVIFKLSDYYDNLKMIQLEKQAKLAKSLAKNSTTSETQKLNYTSNSSLQPNFESPFITVFDIIQSFFGSVESLDQTKKSNNFILDRFLNFKDQNFEVEYEIFRRGKIVTNLDDIMLSNYPRFYKDRKKSSSENLLKDASASSSAEDDREELIQVKLHRLESYGQQDSHNYKLEEAPLNCLNIKILNDLLQPRISLNLAKNSYQQSENVINFKLIRENFLNVDIEVVVMFTVYESLDKDPNLLKIKLPTEDSSGAFTCKSYKESHIIKYRSSNLLVNKKIKNIASEGDLDNFGDENSEFYNFSFANVTPKLGRKAYSDLTHNRHQAKSKNQLKNQLVNLHEQTVVDISIHEAFYENLFYNKKKYLIRNGKYLENKVASPIPSNPHPLYRKVIIENDIDEISWLADSYKIDLFGKVDSEPEFFEILENQEILLLQLPLKRYKTYPLADLISAKLNLETPAISQNLSNFDLINLAENQRIFSDLKFKISVISKESNHKQASQNCSSDKDSSLKFPQQKCEFYVEIKIPFEFLYLFLGSICLVELLLVDEMEGARKIMFGNSRTKIKFDLAKLNLPIQLIGATEKKTKSGNHWGFLREILGLVYFVPKELHKNQFLEVDLHNTRALNFEKALC